MLMQPAWLVVLVLSLLVALVVIFAPRPQPPHDTKLLSASDAPPPALFVIPASGTTAERGFASLAGAVAAAAPGSVIEFHFNGMHALPLLRLDDKPLVLRAAPGFEPVLTSAQADSLMLNTRSALVLEGLTLITSGEPPEAAAPPRRSDVGQTGVSVNEAPFLAAHCRFEIEFIADPNPRTPLSSVLLVNVSAATFLNCEFVSQRGVAIHAQRRRSLPDRDDARFLVQGCAVYGNLITGNRPWPAQPSLELRGNTICGDALIILPPQPNNPARPFPPIKVSASDNVFTLDQLLRPVRAPSAPLETVLRWEGGNNVYSVREFCANTTPPVIRHEEWLASVAAEETNSLSAELGIRARFANLSAPSRTAAAAALVLSAEDRQRLMAQGWTSPEPPGANPQKTGPGQAYRDWRNGPVYSEWTKLVREHIPQNTASR